ncbi:luciferin sulfotransferase-like isoform X2 [Thrips palmi]|uniref:Luciferin sulfotransferase-like isoform X2 n=1 Tax=Thrips palmi TaxID=161013 RepID=A0A6P9AHY2_THRPL|nr:luciferin sulfotransferase-like isoform X2 [Thrips palmi]
MGEVPPLPADAMPAVTPVSLVPVDPSGREGGLLQKYFMPAWRKGYLQCGPTKCAMPARFGDLAQTILDMDVRDDDVWVVSHPKTGTTWTQEMVWLIGNDLDYAGAKVNLPERFPFIDHTALFDYRTMDIPMPELPEFVTDSVGFIDRLPGRRFVKTHLPYQLLPTQLQDPKCKAKMVYVCRNAKDTCVSYFHHCRLLEGYTGDFQDFCNLFLSGAVCFGPFWDHVLDFWKRRDQHNVLFITYEQLKQDLAGVIRRTAAFLGKQMDDDQVERLKDHLSFESMKNNPAVNYEEVIEINRRHKLITEDGVFMRSGTVGNWKVLMSPEQSKRFDDWSAENLKGTGLEL